MGRRSSIVTRIKCTINQDEISEIRRQREEMIKSSTINSESGSKVMKPVYRVSIVDFNEETRNCKINFIEVTKYRTIERYVTQNYVKHPIYSNWKTKTKIVKKSIILDDETLESLQKNADALIAHNAFQIIDRISNEEYYPSWYWKDLIMSYYNKKMIELRNKKEHYEQRTQEYSKELDSKTNEYKKILSELRSNLASNKKYEEKYQSIIDKIDSSSKSIALKIITFGIYAYLVSKERYNRYLFKYNYYNKMNADNIRDIANLEGIIALYQDEKETIESLTFVSNLEFDRKKEVLNVEKNETLSLVVPLVE